MRIEPLFHRSEREFQMGVKQGHEPPGNGNPKPPIYIYIYMYIYIYIHIQLYTYHYLYIQFRGEIGVVKLGCKWQGDDPGWFLLQDMGPNILVDDPGKQSPNLI